jgi:hypothetical protein
MEVGKANVAFLTFITCTVTSILELQILLWFLFSPNILASRPNTSLIICLCYRTSGGPHSKNLTVTTLLNLSPWLTSFHTLIMD